MSAIRSSAMVSTVSASATIFCVLSLVRALERGVDRCRAHLKRGGHLCCREAEYGAKDQHPALPARDVLQGGDERDFDAVALLICGVHRHARAVFADTSPAITSPRGTIYKRRALSTGRTDRHSVVRGWLRLRWNGRADGAWHTC